ARPDPERLLVLECYVDDFEVVVGNDGSHDRTGEVLNQLRRQYGSRLRVITHSANRGYGGALRSGFENARKDWVFYTDGDGQYDVGELPNLLARIRPGVDWSTVSSWSEATRAIGSGSAAPTMPSRGRFSASVCKISIAITA